MNSRISKPKIIHILIEALNKFEDAVHLVILIFMFRYFCINFFVLFKTAYLYKKNR